MKKGIIIVLITIAGLQTNARNTNSMKALFIYQFTKMIEWPQDTKMGMFRIGVLGSFNAYKDISDITMGRNVGSQNIEVMNVMNISQLGLTNYHILVVGENFCSPNQLQEINAALKGKATLIIANKENYQSDDVCIGFKQEGENITYMYTYPCIIARGLQCSKDFIALGIKKE